MSAVIEDVIVVDVADVTKYFGARPVLEGVSCQIQQGETVGLVGPNGAGKSTLFRLLAGEESVDKGTLTFARGTTVAYMAQDPEFRPGSTVLEEVLEADESIAGLQQELQSLERRMGQPDVYEDPEALAEVVDQHERASRQFERLGGLNHRGRAESTLRALGIEADAFGLAVEALSGGQRKLVALARALLCNPEVLLLDEPDNHLDLEGKSRLERIIAGFPGTAVVISHDRHLLDVLVDAIVEVEVAGQHPGRPQLSRYAGNYSEYVNARQLELHKQEKDFAIGEREARRLKQSILRLKAFSSGGQNQKLVRRWKSMQKRLDRLDRTERPLQERRRIGLRLDSRRGSKKVLETGALTKSFSGNEVLAGVDLLIVNGERVGLVGRNGSGKSVLMRTILGEMEPTGGWTRLGPSISVGFYSQEHETLDPDRTPVEEVRRARPMSEGDAYAFLGRFLFDYEKARSPVSSLSGGEKSRLQLAKLMLAEANLLLLDEPTNNLDIASAEALEEALEEYTGTVFAISHDRYFLERIAGRVIELEGGRLAEFPAGYRQYADERAGSA